MAMLVITRWYNFDVRRSRIDPSLWSGAKAAANSGDANSRGPRGALIDGLYFYKRQLPG